MVGLVHRYDDYLACANTVARRCWCRTTKQATVQDFIFSINACLTSSPFGCKDIGFPRQLMRRVSLQTARKFKFWKGVVLPSAYISTVPTAIDPRVSSLASARRNTVSIY